MLRSGNRGRSSPGRISRIERAEIEETTTTTAGRPAGRAGSGRPTPRRRHHGHAQATESHGERRHEPGPAQTTDGRTSAADGQPDTTGTGPEPFSTGATGNT